MSIPFKYNLRSLFVRKTTTLMTILSIAFVVLVFIGVMSLGAGLERAFGASGDPSNLLVLRDGARSETESGAPIETYREVAALPGVEREANGTPLASGELIVLQIFTRGDGSESNVTVRGVGEVARKIRPAFEIVEGRDLVYGKGEIIVGKNLAGRFPSLRLGEEASVGRMKFRVVGTFGADGGGPESEVWGAIDEIGATFRRSSSISSIRLRTSSKESAKVVTSQIEDDQRWRLQVKTETQYYAEQTDANTGQFKVLGTMLAVLMGIGACFAAANTMYAHVAKRSREIGTLRALGFRRRAILIAFLFEAALLGLLGGVTGALLSLPLNTINAGTTNFVTFSEITFRLQTSPSILLTGIFIAILTGVIGGFPPALSAARGQIAGQLREA